MKNLLLLILFLSPSAFGQRSIADLEPQHREALKYYLKTRASMSLRLESVLDREYLASMIQFLGAGLKPNYAVGDFNGDKRRDFAVLLTRPGRQRNLPTGEEGHSSEHFPDYPLHLVVFNGAPGSAFKPAFSMNFFGPNAAFLQFNKKSKRLYYGVYETDNMFSLSPRGSGYRVRNEGL